MYKTSREKQKKSRLTEVLDSALVLLWLPSPFFKGAIMLTHFTGDRHFYHRPLHFNPTTVYFKYRQKE